MTAPTVRVQTETFDAAPRTRCSKTATRHRRARLLHRPVPRRAARWPRSNSNIIPAWRKRRSRASRRRRWRAGRCRGSPSSTVTGHRPEKRSCWSSPPARHRAEAFAAAEFLMDYLKTSAPFWKKEHRADGPDRRWVDAKASDDQAAARWTKDSLSQKRATAR